MWLDNHLLNVPGFSGEASASWQGHQMSNCQYLTIIKSEDIQTQVRWWTLPHADYYFQGNLETEQQNAKASEKINIHTLARGADFPKPSAPAHGCGSDGSDCTVIFHLLLCSVSCFYSLAQIKPECTPPASPPSTVSMRLRFRVAWPGEEELQLNECGSWPGEYTRLSEHSGFTTSVLLLILKIF